MSVLDMFASALGAFIMISVILFPYFNRSQQLEQVKAQIQHVAGQLRRSTEQLRKLRRVSQNQKMLIQKVNESRTALIACQKQKKSCTAKVTKVFLVVGMEWDEQCDVDLHVIDPAGNEFAWNHPTHTGSKAELSIDMQYGPGIEVWQDPEALDGIYQVNFKNTGYNCPALSEAGDSIAVKGWVLDRSGGFHRLHAVTLTNNHRCAKSANVTVTSDGVAKVRSASGDCE